LIEQIESFSAQLQELEQLKEEMNKTKKSEVEYKSVKIGNVLWMTENLKVKTFSNGDPIPEANTKESWEAAVENGTPAWCYYNFNPANEAKYGILYNIYVFADLRGIGIDGWGLPEKEDVFDMLIAVGAKNVENGIESSEIAKKIIGKTSFKNYAGSNNSGLNLMPTGYASSQMFQSGEYFYGKDSYTGFWTALFGETKLEIGALTIDVCCGLTYPDFHPSSDGLPIRLIKTLK